MSNYRQALGKWGEETAAQYLVNRGYKMLARNFRTPYGEIDLVAMQHEAVDGIDAAPIIVFVEVKTRSNTAFGFPEASINPRKQEHILAAAQYYLLENPNLDWDWRVDVIAIQRHSRSESPSIEHFENVFTTE